MLEEFFDEEKKEIGKMTALEVIRANLKSIKWVYQVMLGETNYFVGCMPDGRKVHFGGDQKEKVMKLWIDKKSPLPMMHQDVSMLECFDILESAIMNVDVNKSYLVNRILNILDIFDVREIGSQFYCAPDEYVPEAEWLMNECIKDGPKVIDSSLVKECWDKFFGDVDEALKEKESEVDRTTKLINDALWIYWNDLIPHKDIYEHIIDNHNDVVVLEKEVIEDENDESYNCQLGNIKFNILSDGESVYFYIFEADGYFYSRMINKSASFSTIDATKTFNIIKQKYEE